MKKVLFTIGMIAILVGVAFAGIAAAGTNSVPGNLANVPRIQSYMDWVGSNQDETILTSQQYNNGAHFSLTILANAVDPGEKILVQMNFGQQPIGSGWISGYETITGDGLYKYEFDAGSCRILTLHVSNVVGIAYAMTVTSPP